MKTKHVLMLVWIWFVLMRFAVADDQIVSFEQHIQPIFKTHCDACHGQQLQESNYRLDVRSKALAAADFGQPPIVPNQPDDSPLLHYVAGTSDDGLVMPPEGEGQPLSADQIDLLRRWIAQGATWPDALANEGNATLITDHWSFQPVQRPEVPVVADQTVANPIDAFLVQKLADNGLSLSAPADRRTLIRRIHLDMLGLPPSPEEVDRFVNDPAPDAYQALVEKVLQNPHYGERWAQHWLDVVRFGETNGFETNQERPNAYHYRDYVIAALNDDKPYDQFVREQIAGDALQADAATGFLVAGAYDIVKSPDIRHDSQMQRQDELADMVNTTGTAFLGLTVGCARCHNHKFDPILQKDYYSMQAVFAGVQFGERAIQSIETIKLQQQIAAQQQEIATLQAEFEQLRQAAPPQPEQLSSDADSKLREPVNSLRNEENFPAVNVKRVRFRIFATTGGQPCIDEWEVLGRNQDGQLENVALASRGAKASASGSLAGYDIHKLEHIHDGQFGNAHSWICDQTAGWVQIDFVRTEKIERMVWQRDREGMFKDRLAVQYTIEGANDGDWFELASSADRQPSVDSTPDPNAFIARLDPAAAARANSLLQQMETIKQQISQWQNSLPKAWAGTFSQPGPVHRLYRGDPLAKREEVAPDALTVTGSLGLPTDAPEQSRREKLAEWIASEQNPLTARVLVNRLWHYHFGTGMVATPSDFGANGIPPSHPELLDYLASEFVQNGWSIKHMHRLILTSQAFQQSSAPRADSLRKDADCRLLWRFPPRRLEAETIRDCVLAVSGALNLEAGGPGFKVFNIKKETVHHYFPKEEFGTDEWRRMVYMTKIRQEQDAVFGVFDCPDGGQVIPDRSRSTTALQALNMLNSAFMLQQADLLQTRLQREANDSVEAQVTLAFRLLFGRTPSDEELTSSLDFIRENSMRAFCRAILNANEFIFLT
ncbi:MAG: PSD1 and planctomycete cytochrome C domain-containing protein [Pirellulaceae bacterium]